MEVLELQEYFFVGFGYPLLPEIGAIHIYDAKTLISLYNVIVRATGIFSVDFLGIISVSVTVIIRYLVTTFFPLKWIQIIPVIDTKDTQNIPRKYVWYSNTSFFEEVNYGIRNGCGYQISCDSGNRYPR